jgi:hypothetical protein
MVALALLQVVQGYAHFSYLAQGPPRSCQSPADEKRLRHR